MCRQRTLVAGQCHAALMGGRERKLAEEGIRRTSPGMALVALLAVATAATSDPTRPRGKCNPEIVDTDWRTLRRITSVPDPRVLPGDNADANKTLDGLYHEVVCRLAAADGPLTLYVVGDSTMATQLAHIHFAIRWEVERQSLAGTAKQLTSCTTPCSELPPDTVSYGDISNFNLDECFLEAGEAIDHGLYQNNGSAPGPPIEALPVGDAELAGRPYSTAGSLVSAGVLGIGRLRATIGGKSISVVSVISRRSVMTMPQAASMLDVLRKPPYNFEELKGPLLAYVQAFGMHHMHSGNYVDFEHKAPLAAVPGYRARLQAGLEELNARVASESTVVLMTTHAVCETDEVARYTRECTISSVACESVCKEATPDDQKPFATPVCSFVDPKIARLYEHMLSSAAGSSRLAWNERAIVEQHPSLAGLLDAHNMTLNQCNHSSDGRHYDITVVHAEVVELLSRFQLPPRPRGASQRLESALPICAAGDTPSAASPSPSPAPEAADASAKQEAFNWRPPTGGFQRLTSKRQPSPLEDAEALGIISRGQSPNAEKEEAHIEAWDNAPRPREERETQPDSGAKAVSNRQQPFLHRPAAHGNPEQEEAHFDAWKDAPRSRERGERLADSGATAAAVRTVSALAQVAEHEILLRPPTRAAFARDHPYDPYLAYRHLAPQNM